MQAEIIAIGTELLLGNTLDTNTQYLAILLRRLGIDLYRTTIIGDNADRIALAVKESLSRADIIVTTGGLGPTIDDATREGIARAMDCDLVFQPELWRQIQTRFRRFKRRPTENNRRQAYIPNGAVALENPVGTAPAFYIELEDQLVVSLPGVPAELSYLAENELMKLLETHDQSHDVILTRHLRTAGIGESWLDQKIQDLEQGLNPTVGLSARPGKVDIRITAKAEREVEAKRMLAKIENELRQRLGNHIYGVDEQSLEATVASLLESQGLRLVMCLNGFPEAQQALVIQRIVSPSLVSIEMVMNPDELRTTAERLAHPSQSKIGLTLQYKAGLEGSPFTIGIFQDGQWEERQRSYGGAPEYAFDYAINHALDALRRYLLDNVEAAAL
jgi:competence/damage-inducible protein CinA-like protein